MEHMTMLLIGLGLLLLAWVVYRKFVALPPHPTQCETKCVDGVCFPSCSPDSNPDYNPTMNIGDHGSNALASNTVPEELSPKNNESKKTE